MLAFHNKAYPVGLAWTKLQPQFPQCFAHGCTQWSEARAVPAKRAPNTITMSLATGGDENDCA
eukprot:6474775-Amphidinium_carterae.1